MEDVMTDANEIIHALRLWFQAGDVFEVRVLDAVSADYRREHIESGYFDYEHISAVPEALKRLLSFRGVYVTVNPVNPDLLARAGEPSASGGAKSDDRRHGYCPAALASDRLRSQTSLRRVQFELGTRLRAGQGSRDPRRAFLPWLG